MIVWKHAEEKSNKQVGWTDWGERAVLIFVTVELKVQVHPPSTSSSYRDHMFFALLGNQDLFCLCLSDYSY